MLSYLRASQRPLYRLFAPTFWILLPSICLNDHVVEVTEISGSSMSPTLSPAFDDTGRTDWLVWSKWHPTRDLQRGDVVHFSNPRKPEACAVKRVIALEGDTVILDRRRRPFRKSGEEHVAAAAWDARRGRALVPPGHVWVEGDNWRNSLDSNYYGPISKSLINGRASFICWPWERFRTKPWERWQMTTAVVEGGSTQQDWTDGVSKEWAEIGALQSPPLEEFHRAHDP